MIRFSVLGLLTLLLMVAGLQAQAETKGPHKTIEQATVSLVDVIVAAKGYYEQDPDRYYHEIEQLVEPLIDFPTFARSVMGPYGTRDYYISLKTPEAREVFKQQYSQFVETFKQGLINTYGKGLLAFNGQTIAVQPPTEEDQQLIAQGESVNVVQKIQGANETYTITYKMRPDKDGSWLVRNVTIESINVGLLYRNQFVASMNKYSGDLEKVVGNWLQDAKDAESQNQLQASSVQK